MNKLAFLFTLLAAFLGLTSAVTHNHALTRLQNAGITIYSSGGCSNRENRRCTSLDRARENTVRGLVALRQSSGCPMTVTGGTERGHSSGTYSHYSGYKADIRLNKCINRYITRNFVSSGVRRDGALTYKDGSGNIYAKEGNHWDILYY